MELKELIIVIRKNFIYVIVLALIGLLVGYSSSRFFSSGYQHTKEYFLAEPSVSNQTGDIRSENFLQQEKSRNFTDSAIAILQSPDFQSEVLMVGDSLVTQKMAPQVIRLTYASPNNDDTLSNIERTVNHFNFKISDLSESSPASLLKPIGSNNPPTYSALSKSSLAASGAILGVIFAIFILGSRKYFKI